MRAESLRPHAWHDIWGLSGALVMCGNCLLELGAHIGMNSTWTSTFTRIADADTEQAAWHQPGPADVELGTAEWADWFDYQRSTPSSATSQPPNTRRTTLGRWGKPWEPPPNPGRFSSVGAAFRIGWLG